jgi:hypothetical protein
LPAAPPGPAPVFNGPAVAPNFTIERTPAHQRLGESLRVFFQRIPRSSNPIRFFKVPASKTISGRSFGSSVLLHGLFILFLVYLHHAFPPQTFVEHAQVLQPIYYTPPPIPDSAKRVPRITPAGVGGRPGNALQS